MENCALILADDTRMQLLGNVFHRHEVIPRESPVYITKLYFPAVTLDAIAAASMPKKSSSLQIGLAGSRSGSHLLGIEAAE
jgi:hypothetical protein